MIYVPDIEVDDLYEKKDRTTTPNKLQGKLKTESPLSSTAGITT